MQTAYCRPGSICRLRTRCRLSSMQNADWQEKLLFCRQKRGNIRFYKSLILGISPCLWYRWSRWDDYYFKAYLGGSWERGRQCILVVSLEGYSIYPGMGRWGPAPGSGEDNASLWYPWRVTRYILGWGDEAQPLTWPRYLTEFLLTSFKVHVSR